MALSTQRKVFLGVLALSGGSFFVERGLLSGPSSSIAAEPLGAQVDPIDGSSSIATLASIDPGIGASIGALRARLGAVETPEPETDITAMFFPRVVERSEHTGGEEPRGGSRIGALPALSAVMPAPGGGSAVIDGEMVRIGERTRSGFVLVRVVSRRAVVERGGREYTLSLPVRR